MATKKAGIKIDGLVGRFFHSFQAEKVGSEEYRVLQYCGRVVARPEPGYYLIELNTCQMLVRIEDMVDWYFYDDVEWQQFTYEHELLPKTKWVLAQREAERRQNVTGQNVAQN